MKLRKILSTIVSVAMLSAVVSSFTVAEAAQNPALSLSAVWDSDNEGIAVTVSYSGLNDNHPNTNTKLKPTIVGISTASFVVESKDKLTYMGGIERDSNFACSSVEASAACNISKSSDLVAETSGDLATFYFAGEENGTYDFIIKEATIRVKSYITGNIDGTVDFLNAEITKTGCTYGEVAGPTVTADAVVTKDSTVVDGGANYGFGGKVEANGKPFTGLKFTFDNKTTQKEYIWNFGTVLNTDTTFGLNLMGVPEGITVTATIEPIVADE